MGMIGTVFNETVRKHSESTAVVDGDAVLTYGELAARRDALVSGLSEHYGIVRGDRVAVSLPNCWQFAALFLSLAELGGIAVLLNPNWRSGELRGCMERVQPAAVVAGKEQAAYWQDLGYPSDRIISPERISLLARPYSSARYAAVSNPPAGSDHAVYLLTSGSTGVPKIVTRSQRNLVAGARNVAAALGGLARKRFLSVIPYHHANGFANCLLLPLLAGGSVHVVAQFFPRTMFEAVARFRPDVLIGSPFIFSAMIDAAGPKHDLGSLDLCLSSGAPIKAELVHSWMERFGLRIRQLYGSSETGTISIEDEEAPVHRLTAGRPIPSVEVRIDSVGTDADGADVGGEILVKGPAAMTGYLHEPESNRQSFVDGFFRTGDLGRFDQDGNIVILGRRRRVINLKGVKVDPCEIENLILEHPAVAGCLVMPADRGGGDEIVSARISVREGRSVSRAEIIEHCRACLAEYKIPRIIEISGQTGSGILGKRSLY
jgi:long-chain acyl-CoA synthetase